MVGGRVIFFFFKQKTAYEMLRSLVGSEMCIRDRPKTAAEASSGASTGIIVAVVAAVAVVAVVAVVLARRGSRRRRAVED